MNKTIIASIIFMSVVANCQGQKSATKDTLQFYFPLAEVFKDTSSYVKREPFHNAWYSKHLNAMKEPVIYVDNTLNEIYRFTWLRSFHHPIAIRIEKQENKYMLYWKVCNGAGGYDPGELIIDKKKTLDENTWTEFKKLLDQVDFWNLQTSERIPTRMVKMTDGSLAEEVTIGTDGAQWILEGRINPQYHVVVRWTPNKESTYYQCCDFLIKLTDIEINDRDKY